MTSKDFIIWLKGYMDGLDPDHDRSEFTKIREEIEKINDSFTFIGVPNSAPIVTLPHVSPLVDNPTVNPYQVGDFPQFGGTSAIWTTNLTNVHKINATNDDKMDQESN
jgi:hypothetical protein